MERPAKRVRLDSESEASDGEAGAFSINREYAQRFEHNKQREEKQRLEEKFKDLSDEESSSDESEDDDADLITPDLDQEIMTTLTAIKSKDPRVYDTGINFYRAFDADDQPQKSKKESTMTLKDYHRENLLAGYTGAPDEEANGERLPTWQEEQDSLKQNVVNQLNALADADEDDDDGFIVKREGVHSKVMAPARPKITTADIAAADKDPETFLSNFMAAQAWRPTDEQQLVPFDSDASEDEDRADAFEAAYNLRFEDPETSNEKLKSFARDAGQYSVRREATGGRKKAREREREEKEQAKQERQQERERLKKLKISEAEEKLQAIKKAAGMAGQDADVQQWRDLLEGDFDDDAWDVEMRQRFGEQYYATTDAAAESSLNKQRPKKPTWDDEIDVDDIAPGLDNDDGGFALTDEEDAAKEEKQAKKRSKDAKREAQQSQKRDRRLIEQMVEASLPAASTSQGAFRYRDTSPVSFGMGAQDILFASDAQLNQFAGLKKLAPFRDEDRKARDRKKLGKKARLREWRRDVFGKEEPDFPTGPAEAVTLIDELPSSDKKASKKRKRKNKHKSAA